MPPLSMKQALAAGQLYVALQPVVDLQRRKLFGYESLLRSYSPAQPDPLTMISAAIAEGFMGELGRELRLMALRGCSRTHLFLNVHPSEFDEGWLVRPDDAIFNHDQFVYIEITESAPISHFRWCQSVLREVRSKGVYLAVDDLGAGYSNFKYIADLSPEIVKLDRELIMNLDADPRRQKLVKSLVRLCEDLGAEVVAEGIETPEELRAVIDSGARYGQGYLLARPALPAPAVHWECFGPKRGGGTRR